MIAVRPSAERGVAKLGWLESHHTFSFDQYYDPRHMGFRSLRVINEDHVAPRKGFPPHPHRDMEIVTYVLAGALLHQDTTGGGSVIHPGEVQRMSAGSGITHSEFNPSPGEPVHLLQIWIRPREKGIRPSYEQRDFSRQLETGALVTVASGNGANGAVAIQQDAELLAARLKAGARATHNLASGRHAWLQIARGAVEVNGVKLDGGDGAAISDIGVLNISALSESEFLLFDLA